MNFQYKLTRILAALAGAMAVPLAPWLRRHYPAPVVVHHALPLAQGRGGPGPLRLVFLSDLHAGPTMTGALLKTGQRMFIYSYHSPSLALGHTPYVQSESDLQRFLDGFEQYFDYFTGELGGRAATPHEVRDLLTSAPAGASRLAPSP